MKFLHENKRFEDVLEAIATSMNISMAFVEKLSAISKKYRQYKETGEKDRNFMRHYYDIFMLLKRSDVQAFLGTEKYLEHKMKRFGAKDEFDLTKNEAFSIPDKTIFAYFESEHKINSALHYDKAFPSFQEIIDELGKNLARM